LIAAMVVAALFASIRTVAQVTVYPWQETFTGCSALPSGWDNDDYANPGYQGVSPSLRWELRDEMLHFLGNNAARTEAAVKSPALTLPNNYDVTLTFRLKNNMTCGRLGAYVSTDGGVTYMQNALDSNLRSGNGWTERSLSLAQYRGQTVNIVFVGRSCQQDKVYYTEFYVDDIEVDATPICKVPVNMNIYALTDTSAVLLWDLGAEGSTPASYQFSITDAQGHSSSSTLTTHYSTTLGNLAPNTEYTITLRSDCSAESKGYSRYSTMNFTTLCSPQSLPFTADFDNTPDMPSCCITQNCEVNTINGALKMSAGRTEIASFVSPRFTIPADSIEISFRIKRSNTNYTCKYHVGIVSDPSDILGTFYELRYDSLTTGADWYDFRANSSEVGFSSTDVAFCIFVESGEECIVYVDDIVARKTPTCIRPEGMSSSNVTATTATVAWTTTNAAQYRVTIIGESDTTCHTTTATSLNLAGLTPNRDYRAMVRALCSASDSSDMSTEILFRTLCATATTPYFGEGFESAAIPECWSNGMMGTPQGTAYIFSTSTRYHHSGAQSMALPKQTPGNKAYLATNMLPLNGNCDVALYIWRDMTSDSRLRIWATPTAGDTTGGTLIGTLSSLRSAAPAEASDGWYMYQFPIAVTGNRHIMIEGTAGTQAMYIDDLAIITSPTCRKVSGITATAQSGTTAMLQWTANGTATQWRIRCNVYSGTSAISAINQTVTSPQMTISGLSAGEYYNIAGTITSICSTQDTSESVAFNLFVQTPCTQTMTLPVSEGFESNIFPPLCWQQSTAQGSDTWYVNSENYHSGAHSAFVSSHSVEGRTILATPEFALSGTPSEVKVNIFRGSENYSMIDEALHIYLSTTATDTASALMLGSIPQNYTLVPAESKPGWYPYIFTIPTSETGNRRILFVYHSQAGSGAYIDDITVRHTPACADIQCRIDSITSTSITAKPTTQGCSTWQYMIDANAAVTVNDTTATIVNLMPKTTYQIRVRQTCGTSYGEWSDPMEFTTACSVASLPYIEDFENVMPQTTPNCMTIEKYYQNTMAVANTTASEQFNHTEGGSRGLTTAIAIDNVLSPAMSAGALGGYAYVHLEAGNDYEYTLQTHKASYTTQEFHLSLYYGTTPDHTRMTMMLSPQTISTDEWVEIKRYFSVPATGDYYIGFLVNAPMSGQSYAAYIDDIAIRRVDCVPPTASFVSSTRSTSATIILNAATGSQWEVAVSDHPITPSAALRGNIYHCDTITRTTFTIPSLNPATTYYYTIRTVCNTGTSTWMEPQSFATRCASVSFPYSDSFEDVATAQCWTSAERTIAHSHSGIASLAISAGNVASPEFTSQISGHTLTAWVYAERDSAEFNIGTISNPDEPATFEPVADFAVPYANRWYPVRCTFGTLDDPSARYIAISYLESNHLYIDDLNIDATPACPAPTTLEIAGTTANSMTLQWNATTPVAIRMTPAEGGQTVAATCSTSPSTINGLRPSTVYIIRMAGICGNDTSDYMTMGYGETTCGTMTAPYAETFEHQRLSEVPRCWDISASANADTLPELIWNTYEYCDNRMIRLQNHGQRGAAIIRSPQIVLPAGRRWKLDLDYSHKAYCNNFYVRVFRNNKADNLKTIPQGSVDNLSEIEPGAFTHLTIDLSAYAGQTIQLQFNATTTNQTGAIFVDNVRISEIFTCSDLSALTLASITDNSATIAITDTAASHTTWQYIIGEKGFEPTDYMPIATSSKNIVLAGLAPLTEYDIVVRAECSAYDRSNWRRLSFTTTAVPATVPYMTDFSSAVENTNWRFTTLAGSASRLLIGNCTEALLASPQALYVSDDNGRSYEYEYSIPSSTNAYRTIAFGDSIYKFDISYRCTGGIASTDYARIYLMPASMAVPQPTPDLYKKNTFANSIPLDGNNPIMEQSGWQHISTEIDLRGRAGAYNLVFTWANDSTSERQQPLSVGYVEIVPAGCGCNIGLSVDATVNSATVNVSGTSNYEYRLSSSGSPEGYEQSGTSTSPVLTLNGLNHSSRYFIFVRNICSNGKRSTWRSEEFTTACSANTEYPFTETFTDQKFPPVCWETTPTVTGLNWDGTPIDGEWKQFSTTMATDNYSNTPGSVEMSGYNGSAAALATPFMHLDSAREYHVSFYMYRMTRKYALGHITVYLAKKAYPDKDAIILGDYTTYDPTISVNGPRLIDIDLPENLAGDYRILFEGHYVGNTWLFLDDITIDQYPECRKPLTTPTILETSENSIEAYVNLRGHSAARVVIAPFVPGQTTIADTIAGMTTTDGHVVFGGLNTGSMYALYSRIECSAENYSEWTAMSRAETKANGCYAPDGLRMVGQAGPTTATFTYGAASGATTMEYVVTSGSDTLRGNTLLDTLQLSNLTPSALYTLRIRTRCASGDSTAWSTMTFNTLGNSTVAPYHTGFEDGTDNAKWNFAISGSYNNFVISGSNEGRKDGNYGLYISNDNATYNQTVPAAPENAVGYNIAYAMRTIWLEPGMYEAAFDWRCDAYVPGQYSNPYTAVGRAFLVPATTQMVGDATTYLFCNPEGSVSLFAGNMDKSQSWSRSMMTADVREAGYYNITIAWMAFHSGGGATNATAFPLAIDNLSIEEITCRPPYDITYANIRSTTADIIPQTTNNAGYEYGVSTAASSDSIMSIQSTAGDTIHISGLMPKTHYYVYVRHACSTTEKSPWRIVEITTHATEAQVPYVCQFADMNENSNWIIACTGQANYFTVGNTLSNGAGSSLFVTDDGTNNHYDLTTTATAYAYRTIMLDSGYYDISADYRAYGRFTSDQHAYDFGRLVLVPASVEITEGLPLTGLKWDETPSYGWALDNGVGLINQGTWENLNQIIHISEPGDYNIIAYWYNQNQDYGGAGIGNPPVAFDNITVTECLCNPIRINVVSTGETTAQIAIENSNVGAPIRYTLSNIDSPYNPLVCDTVYGNTINLAGLSPSSTYFVYAQAICSEADSKQAHTAFHTACGIVTNLPYCEGFESLPMTEHSDNLGDICWKVLNFDAIDNGHEATPYYNYTDYTNYMHSGQRALRLHGSDAQPMIFILPEFGNIEDVALSMWYKCESVNNAAPMKLGYVTDINDASSFVELQQFAGQNTMQRYSQSFLGAPAGARMAFSYGPGQNTFCGGYVDDIRVARLIHAPATYDTICYGTPYVGNGFNVQANKLHAGDNTLSRVKLSPSDNGNDTLFTTELYVQPRIHTDFFDTCCTTRPYVKGEWNIPNPVSGSYVHNYPASSGCDSSVILYLHVLPASQVIADSICTGDAYMFHGNALTQPGMYIDSAQNALGCMTIDTLYLMVLPDSLFHNITICSTELPYQFYGRNLTATGRYYQPVTGAKGCSQTDVLDLYVVPTDTFYSHAICQGGSYLFVDTVITTAGTYTRHRISASGCDMTHHLTTTINPILTGDTYDYACEGYAYYGNGINGVMITADTTVDVTTKNGDMCDSLTHVHLILVATTYSEEYKTISKGESYTWHDNSYTKAGDYTTTLQASTGCDSVVTLHLSVINSVEETYEMIVKIVPNPVNHGDGSLIGINHGDGSLIDAVEIINPLGETIDRIETISTPVEIKAPAIPGVYIIKAIFADGHTITEKLIVK